MNWNDLAAGGRTAEILEHWRKLGRFRRAHPAVGAGEHRLLQASPYVFARTLEAAGQTDRVVVGLDQPRGAKTVSVAGIFPDGARLVDAYSGQPGTVADGKISLTTTFDVVLLSEERQ
jgi:alpha-amylase